MIKTGLHEFEVVFFLHSFHNLKFAFSFGGGEFLWTTRQKLAQRGRTSLFLRIEVRTNLCHQVMVG